MWMMKICISTLVSPANDVVRRGNPSAPQSRPRLSRRDRRRRAMERARRLQGAYLMDLQDAFSDTAR